MQEEWGKYWICHFFGGIPFSWLAGSALRMVGLSSGTILLLAVGFQMSVELKKGKVLYIFINVSERGREMMGYLWIWFKALAKNFRATQHNITTKGKTRTGSSFLVFFPGLLRLVRAREPFMRAVLYVVQLLIESCLKIKLTCSNMG